MIKLDERKAIIETIEDNYCFNNNEVKWKPIKEEILNAECEDNREYIDLQLCKMGDPHLRVYNTAVPSDINLGDILVSGGNIYLFYQNKYCQVSYIDGIESKDVLAFYENRYAFLPDNVIYGELTKDYKVCQGLFKGNKHFFEFDSGDKVIIRASNVSKIHSIIPQNADLGRFEPVIVVQIDDKTVLIKLVTLNYKGIYDLFLNKLNLDEVKAASNIILDLRDNQGGFIGQAEKILSLLIKNDVVMPYHIVDRDMRYDSNVIKAFQHDNIKDKNIYVFINRYTMSSAEYILALGLKTANDSKVTLVGEKTAGSTGQAKVFKISDECLLYVTTKRYYKCDEQELKEGISPDIELGIVTNGDISKDNYIEWYREERI